MFMRVAVVNRGEAAMRLIHAIREYNAGYGTRIETIALYTDADRTATFVRETDHVYYLGQASDRPYLDFSALEAALVDTGADAAWVGWGFVAEDPTFAELCEKLGVTFIGPSAEAMRKLGDKIGAKLIAEEVGVPVAPWSRGAIADFSAARDAAAEIGYPLMLKATAGGGGRGIRVVNSDAELNEAYERTSTEAERAFGSGVVFLERLVTGARHVEVQVIADGQGTAWALGVRDCSVQRKNQKIIEESSSPLLSSEQTAELKAAAERLALAVDYQGAGTVEFLYHPGERLFAFLEVNTRLQVEHPITEATTGVDLVKTQLHVAAGGTLLGDAPAEAGHAIEARLNAEDPDREFAPSPGRIALLELPAGAGIRVDTGVTEGDSIPADFDSMIAKIIAYGTDRAEALARLRRAMAETTVIIEGGASNKSFVLELLYRDEVIEATVDTGWIDRVRAEGDLVTTEHSGIALATAAIEAYEDGEAVERQRLLSTAYGGRPQVQHEGGQSIDLKLRGVAYRVAVARIGQDTFRIGVAAGGPGAPAQLLTVRVERFDTRRGQLVVNGRPYRVVSDTHGPTHFVEVAGIAHRISRDEGGVIRSPAPALVVATPVETGVEVEADTPVLVLESMKMETVLRAPFRATLRERLVAIGSQVATGAPLLRLEPVADDSDAEEAAPADAGPGLDLPADEDEQEPAERVRTVLAHLRGQVLGFDPEPLTEGGALAAYRAARRRLGSDERGPLQAEVRLLEAFADLSELSRNRPAGEESKMDIRVHTPREYLHSYLQSLDVDRAGLPESFRQRLRRALEHYGVAELERSPELEDAVFRIFLAQQRAATDVRIVTSVLQQWLDAPAPVNATSQVAGKALEHLIVATQVRFPEVGDLARSVVFRWFAQPLLRRHRAKVYASVRENLRYLDQHPDATDRADRIDEMVGSTEPLVRLHAQRIDRTDVDTGPLLEVLSRRYYRARNLENVRCRVVAERSCVTAEYDLDGDRLGLVATSAGVSDLDAALAAADEASRVFTATSEVVADVYLTWPEQPADADEMAARLLATLRGVTRPGNLRRITTTVAGPSGAVMHHHFTFRPDGGANGALTEDRLTRGMHPLVAQRLQLPRLRHFDLARLPSADEDVYLFRCVAKENPADERLVAMGQVRDLTPLRDNDGNLKALPALEGALDGCLDAIRNVQAERPTRRRFDTNRVLLYVWPPSELSDTELRGLAQRLAPRTAGAGLEEVAFRGRQRDSQTGELRDVLMRINYDAASGVRTSITPPETEPIEPLDNYRQKVLRANRRGTVYPYELTDMLSGEHGSFVEHDLGTDGRSLVPVDRPKGQNTAAVVTGVVTTVTGRFPEGVTRVVLLGDPTKALGALSEPECSRVVAALDLADRMGVPVEWFALSAGARIAMDSGTENMDSVATALRRIVRFTQDGGEINVVVAGINVGAQPYFNAEATMLMHTKGILVMTPDSAMVLTGKQSLDFSGGVSAEDNFGIGGYDRVMGPNGQAQYWAPNLAGAVDVLRSHYEHTYILPGEQSPRAVPTSDPADRDVSGFPHEVDGSEFATVGEIFSTETNPDRKKPFDIRTVMRAVSDQDHPVLERWSGMVDADTSVVQDAHLGGSPVCLIGIESQPVPRHGFPPTDGPDTFTSGTLFPRSSKKTARAINSASGNRPLVILANLSGFDGSPESMRKLQLEYGAEIGRAIVNFAGPIVFCVISRYHGGAFVVFSKALNENMTVLAVDGSFASVIGGAPAAAVVFAGDVEKRTAADARVSELETRLAAADGAARAELSEELTDVRATVRAEKLGEVAGEFDRTHSVQRAVSVGSVDAIVQPDELRPRIIDAIQQHRSIDAD